MICSYTRRYSICSKTENVAVNGTRNLKQRFSMLIFHEKGAELFHEIFQPHKHIFYHARNYADAAETYYETNQDLLHE
jgi:hypothetical protein